MNRHTVRKALIDQLRAADTLTGVQIELVWPGDQTQNEAIYLLPSQGDVEVPVFHGQPSPTNQVTYQDEFTIPLEVKACKPGQSDVDAEERCELLVNTIAFVVASDPLLGLGDGNTAGLMQAVVTSYDGPGPGRASNGVQAYSKVTITARTRTPF